MSEHDRIADEVFDRLRGYPKRNMENLAAECELPYDELMEQLGTIVRGEEDYIGLGIDPPDFDINEMWRWYELITGEVVPSSIRSSSPFSCSC